jgi:heme/copper-type cytochrome/quinol oxidase subunit 3
MSTQLSIDVSKLPLEAYGSRGTMWWGLMGLIIIESVFFGLLAVSYFYYRIRYVDWPPASLPDIGLPLANLILILAVCIPFWVIERAAPHRDRKWLAWMLAFATVLVALTTSLRVLEFQSLHTGYQRDSYGSITWALLFVHGIELLLTCGETGLLAFYTATNEIDTKHRSDIQLNSVFFYFLAITWVIIFAVIQVGGRSL